MIWEAVKIVNTHEIESIAPLVAIKFNNHEFVIYNGYYDYPQPLEDWRKWKFREKKQTK